MLVPLLLKFCKTINVDLAPQILYFLSSEQNFKDLITFLKSSNGVRRVLGVKVSRKYMLIFGSDGTIWR